MLRRTAAKAFGGSDEGATGGGRDSALRSTMLPPSGEALRRSRVVDRLYEELHLALHARLQRVPPGEGEPAPAHPGLTRPRPRLEGLEFCLEGPRGRVRVIHGLRGVLRAIYEAASPRGEPGEPHEELVSVERQGGEYRPILKPLPTSPEGERFGGSYRRTGFRFTSVAELADRFLSRVGLAP